MHLRFAQIVLAVVHSLSDLQVSSVATENDTSQRRADSLLKLTIHLLATHSSANLA